jgi:hypothetical protein
MPHDTDAMVAAHKAGRQLYIDQAGETSTAQVTAIQIATAAFATVDERVAFVSGYFGEKRRSHDPTKD